MEGRYNFYGIRVSEKDTIFITMLFKLPKKIYYQKKIIHPCSKTRTGKMQTRTILFNVVFVLNYTCQESFMFQKEETSSIAKRSPPTGAPKAEAIPLLKKNNGKKIKCEGNRGNNNAKMACCKLF